MVDPAIRPSRGTVLRVFLLAFAVYAYFMPRWADWNTDSRLDLSHAIVDKHTLTIDAFHWNTWDKAVVGHHFFSDKAPGTALFGAAVYAGFVAVRSAPLLGAGIRKLESSGAWNDAITLGQTDTQVAPAAKGRILGGCQNKSVTGNVQYIPWGNRLVPPVRDWALSKYVITIGVAGLTSALFVAFFFWFIALFTASAIVRWLLTGLYAFATVALPYSTVFYSHQLVAGFLFVAFALIFLRSRGMARWWTMPLVGFLLGLSLLTEYTVALIIGAIGLYALWILRRHPRGLAGLCAAAAVPVIGLFAYNSAAFGGALDTGYSHDFCWSAAQAAGYAGFTYPRLGPLWDLTIGPYRGVFFQSPFLLLALPGAYLMARKGLRLEAALCLFTSAAFVLAISAYWGWNGGRVDGPRYLVPVVPFLAFPIVFYLEWARRRWAAAALAGVAAAASIFVTWALFLGGELFPISWLRNPLFDYSLPALAGNHIAPNAGFFFGLSGWISLLPLVLLLLLIVLWPWGKERTRTVSSSAGSLAAGQ